MSQTLKALGIDQLSVAQRILLVEEIWDSIVAEAEDMPLTELRSRTSSIVLGPIMRIPTPDRAGKTSGLGFGRRHEHAPDHHSRCRSRPSKPRVPSTGLLDS